MSTRPLDLAIVGVSPREAEVLTLVGQRLTNAEIADRLVISVRTVENHVSALLRKLGVPGRRDLAELMPRHRRCSGRRWSTRLSTPSGSGRLSCRTLQIG